MVTALFATNASFVYLLSWVILQEQFVGIRIMALILSTTGISLLAYMDGVADSQTLGGVLTASSAAAGSAIYKVMFKKVMGEVTFGQASETLTTLSSFISSFRSLSSSPSSVLSTLWYFGLWCYCSISLGQVSKQLATVAVLKQFIPILVNFRNLGIH